MAEEYKSEAHQLPAGTVLHDRFEIKRVIGEGGFGITYEGLDRVLNARIAIKEYYMTGFVNRNTAVSLDVIPSVGEKEETFRKNREKFYSEAMVLAKFGDEDGIVRIQDYFQENQTAYIVMEYLDGGSLKDRLNKDGAMAWDEALDLLMPGMVSLEHVHEAGIIHRDISPDNIMLTKSGKIRILDFGAARKTTDADPKSLSVILKPGYAPEEQYRSKGVQGPWTDVYAFCATLYRCITGSVPEEAMDRLVSDTLRPVHFLVPECPVSVSKVIGKGMAVSQKDRYQTLGELIEDLEWARRNPGASELPETRSKDEPLVPADVQGDPFGDLEKILQEENSSSLLPDLQGMFDESLPIVQVSLPGLTTEKRSGIVRSKGTEQRSGTSSRLGTASRPGKTGPSQELDPNATVYAGKVETYTSPQEEKKSAPVPQQAEAGADSSSAAQQGDAGASAFQQVGAGAEAAAAEAVEGTAVETAVSEAASAYGSLEMEELETAPAPVNTDSEAASVPLEMNAGVPSGDVPDRSMAAPDEAPAQTADSGQAAQEGKTERKSKLFSAFKKMFS
ncbi:MAG: serine/threonine protein kinase [Stomatobaculum sp.]|nr:serine/threonine protein kinase [Stomatobaculum sp.]